ncbi:MAG TPA: IlvD/Edd family dehydratase [Candidatus Limnocylindrales bacterium]|nr:IlvD/Edd family dehydratase [Candidatus Limnocylindrales bacterium]
MTRDKEPLRSQSWWDGGALDVIGHRSQFRQQGFPEETFAGRPIIGILNSWSEVAGCNNNLRDLAERVKRGVLRGGGFPVEIPIPSLGEPIIKPTAMLYRNLMAMAVEELIRGNPVDGVVLLSGCDKTTPACLMGAASVDVPAMLVTSGPSLSGRFRNEAVGACTDCWRLHDELRADRISQADWEEFEAGMCRSDGHCSPMGTASTMACMAEALGMAPSGSAAIPAVDSRRRHVAERAGGQILDLVAAGTRPSDIMTREAFENAIRTLHAIGGSTNAVIHLVAIAGRLGVELPLDVFDELATDTPLLANLKPSGAYLMEDFFYAGGLPAVLAQIGDLLHLEARTVTGRTVGEALVGARIVNDDVIRSRDRALHDGGSLAILRGSLCPDGAVLKVSAATPRLLQHEGRAVVFADVNELHATIDDPSLAITPDDVLVLQNGGPVGAPGMPETGHLPMPAELLRRGVTDMVRISDARMSGTGFGTVVLHVAPESAIGGPLALVRTGDRIRLDTAGRRLDVLVAAEELADRRRAWTPRPAHDTRGYRGLYLRTVSQANDGCDLDFLVGRSAPVRAGITHG